MATLQQDVAQKSDVEGLQRQIGLLTQAIYRCGNCVAPDVIQLPLASTDPALPRPAVPAPKAIAQAPGGGGGPPHMKL